MLPLTVLLLVLLPLLATLQYRWVGQVSEGERERMRASLQRSADQMRREFDREITRAYQYFQVDRDGEQPGLYERYGAAYVDWTQTASYPGLVENVFLVEGNPDRTLSLKRVEADGSVTATAWPAVFASLRQELEAIFPPIQTGPELRMLSRRSIGPINPYIPALVIPIVARRGIHKDSFELGLPPPYAIVQLNIDYIGEEFLPALSRLYISGGAESDYHVSVRHAGRSGPDAVIYESDPVTPSSVPDVSVGLMAVRPFDLRIFAISRSPDFPGERPTEAAAASRSVSVRVLRELPGSPRTGEGVPDNGEGAWELALTHRSGSLEAAVTELRRRNLAISSSIMIVLAASVGMILVSTRRARRLAQQQMEFVSAVSHELRTPLAVIRAAAENLADGVVDSIEQTRRYGAVVRSEGRRLSEMVEQTLDFAGIYSPHRKYRFSAVEVPALIDAALRDCEPQIREGDFQVERQVPNDLPEVMADGAAVSRALQNLIQNAMKYGSPPRWIGLTAAARRTSDKNRLEVQISVQDRGAGISARDLPHIFEPFYRGREAVDGQLPGSGLGLSLVKNVVEAHRGRVSVESAPGRGSTFTICLPAARHRQPIRNT